MTLKQLKEIPSLIPSYKPYEGISAEALVQIILELDERVKALEEKLENQHTVTPPQGG